MLAFRASRLIPTPSRSGPMPVAIAEPHIGRAASRPLRGTGNISVDTSRYRFILIIIQ